MGFCGDGGVVAFFFFHAGLSFSQQRMFTKTLLSTKVKGTEYRIQMNTAKRSEVNGTIVNGMHNSLCIYVRVRESQVQKHLTLHLF